MLNDNEIYKLSSKFANEELITPFNFDNPVFTKKLISPFDEKQLQPHSYDCTLHHVIKLARYNSENDTAYWLEETCDNADLILQPREFALAATKEYICMPQDIVGFVQGKSTIGRNGLQIENAGLIDAGFEGSITLELYNMAPWPIRLKAGMPICQLHFTKADAPKRVCYSRTGHYNGQQGPTEGIYKI